MMDSVYPVCKQLYGDHGDDFFIMHIVCFFQFSVLPYSFITQNLKKTFTI